MERVVSSLAFPIFSEARLGSEHSWRRSSLDQWQFHLSGRGWISSCHWLAARPVADRRPSKNTWHISSVFLLAAGNSTSDSSGCAHRQQPNKDLPKLRTQQKPPGNRHLALSPLVTPCLGVAKYPKHHNQGNQIMPHIGRLFIECCREG